MNTSDTLPLDPLTFPLTGSRLIEASAGTGKTFTIAMLYVRLILGHQGAAAFSGGALTPPEILVVTFTEAATKELRDRIRSRLTEAARYFRMDSTVLQSLDQAADPLLQLVFNYPTAEWPSCARKLELAAEWMDEAAISTIHGWCYRMLREHAFASQSLFTQELVTDQSELRAEIVRDYWRTFFYPLTAEALACVTQYWQQPAKLERAIIPLLDHVTLLDSPADQPATIISDSIQNKRNLLIKLKQPWTNWADEILHLLETAKAAKQLDGRKLRADWYQNWLHKLKQWATDPEADTLDLGAGWQRLTSTGINDAWKNDAPPAHPAFAAIADLQTALEQLPDPKLALLRHATHWVAEKFTATQTHHAQIGFDDLLVNLKTALAGEYGEQLAGTIRQQFPVALIDEFQDTDPVQYHIFERIYAISTQRDDCALILIGDPKQAIYAFRGADIYTYLEARKAVQGKLHTLGTNFRSTQAMVNMVNYCFAHIENQANSSGAFLFKTSGDNPIPFLPVKAHGREEVFQVASETQPAMILAILDTQTPLAKSAYITQMSAICATQITAWLNQGKQQQTGFIGPNTPLRPVQPSDIAILVNNSNEAAHIRQALLQRGIRSVYLSDKDTVYTTPQALEIYRWLAACAEPDNHSLLRAALSTPSLGLTLAELDAFNTDEESWEERVLQFRNYHELWQKQGILPLLHRILLDFKCGDRLLALKADERGQSGERIITDFLHLAELLQQASFTLEGKHALLRFLAEQIAAPTSGETDSKKLRLESDADLIKVITIHKAKGLEYPLVFLPFIANTRPVNKHDIPITWHDANGKLNLSLEATPDIIEQADRERLSEDIRKFYVALTRARYSTWLGLAPLADNPPSAVNYLFELNHVPAAHYFTALQTFAQNQSAIHVTHAPKSSQTHYLAATQSSQFGKARRPQRIVRENWRISSYSALRTAESDPGISVWQEDTPQAENLLEAQLSSLTDTAIETPPTDFVYPQQTATGTALSIHHFFKGAQAGVFLHAIMEWLAKHGLTQALADEAALQHMIEQQCQLRQWEAWGPTLVDWIKQILTTPLPFGTTEIRLSTLTSIKAEMEFWVAVDHVNLALLDATVIQHTLAARARPHLTSSILNGILKGFMDLVFEHQGRYYIMDYKSNWLGMEDQAYTAAAMDETVRKNRYELQYVIYLFALHRLLQARLPAYDYDQHIGGAACLFMRGINAPGHGVHFERSPKALIIALEQLFTGQAK